MVGVSGKDKICLGYHLVKNLEAYLTKRWRQVFEGMKKSIPSWIRMLFAGATTSSGVLSIR